MFVKCVIMHHMSRSCQHVEVFYYIFNGCILLLLATMCARLPPEIKVLQHGTQRKMKLTTRYGEFTLSKSLIVEFTILGPPCG